MKFSQRLIAIVLIFSFAACATTQSRQMEQPPKMVVFTSHQFDVNQEYLVIFRDGHQSQVNGSDIRYVRHGYEIKEDRVRFYTNSQVQEVQEIQRGSTKKEVLGVSILVSVAAIILAGFGVTAIVSATQ